MMKKIFSVFVIALLFVSHFSGQNLLAVKSYTMPDQPMNLIATAFSPTEVHLTWDDVSNETRYNIYTQINSVWTLIDTTGINVCSYSHQNLNPQTNYCYAVASFNSGIPSNLSNNSCATTLVGVKEQTKNKISLKLYPNPTKDKLFIESEIESTQYINITNTLGQVMASILVKEKEIDVSSLPKGIYFISFKLESQIKTYKFIKE